MKKVLIATGVAVLAIATVASAQAFVFNTNLTVGSTGPDVVNLQTALIAAGYDIPAITSNVAAKGYFGSQTKSAVMAYQAARGIPNTGFVGPLTRAALNGGTTGGTAVNCPPGFVCTPSAPVQVACPVGFICTPVGGGAPITSTGGLNGTFGALADANELSQYSSEEVGDGQNDVKVLGLELETTTDGDIRVTSVKVSFDATGNTGSDNLDDYIDSVSIWLGDDKVGESDVSDFNEDSSNVWSKTIPLSGNTIIRKDSAVNLYVSVDAVSNLDSGDISGDSWTVDIENVRYEDGSGVTTTDTGFDIDGMDVPISFVSFSTAADTDLKFSKDSSSPAANIVMVDENDETDDVLLLVGKIKLEGTSDATIDELPITFTVGGTATGLASTTSSVKLMLGSESFTESVTSSFNTAAASVTFDNLDFEVSAGETVTFKVYADVLSTDGALTEGDYMKADVTASNRAVADVENEEGDQLTSSERSGTVVGEYQEFRTEGIAVTLVGTPTAVSNNADSSADTGTFKIQYKITAFGDTVYIASLASAAVTYSVYDSAGTATTSNTIAGTIKNETDLTKTSVGNYEIQDGESETFTLTVTVPNGAGDGSDQYYMALTGVKWDTSDDTSPANTYSSDLDNFQTPTVYLDNS